MGETFKEELWDLKREGADQEIKGELDQMGGVARTDVRKLERAEEAEDYEAFEADEAARDTELMQRGERELFREHSTWKAIISRAQDFRENYNGDLSLSIKELIPVLEGNKEEIAKEVVPESLFYGKPKIVEYLKGYLKHYTDTELIDPGMTLSQAIVVFENEAAKAKDDLDRAVELRRREERRKAA
jgi:hypothetical protein